MKLGIARPLQVKNRMLAITAEASWFGDQLRRLADGLDADPTISPHGSIVLYLATGPVRGLRHRFTWRPPS